MPFQLCTNTNTGQKNLTLILSTPEQATISHRRYLIHYNTVVKNREERMLGPLYTSLSSALHIVFLVSCAGSYLKLRTITLLVLFWWKFNETKTNTKIQTRTVFLGQWCSSVVQYLPGLYLGTTK